MVKKPPLYTPAGLNLQVSEQHLTATKRWFKAYHIIMVVFGIFWLCPALILALNAHNELFTAGCPFALIGLALLYGGLAGLFNETVITVNDEYLRLEHQPFPYFGGDVFNRAAIEQLYMVEQISLRRYDLYLLPTAGKPQKLITLDTPEQGLYLEQQIEQFLGIEDRPVPGEMGQPSFSTRSVNWQSWQTLAERNRLKFTPGKFLENYRVAGHYRNCPVELFATRAFNQYDTVKTHLIIQLPANSSPSNLTGSRPLEDLLDSLNHLKLKGRIHFSTETRKISYEQVGVETDLNYLQSLLESLGGFGGAYPHFIAAGAKMIAPLAPIARQHEYPLRPLLEPSAREKDHPFRQVAIELIREITRATRQLAPQHAQLVCPTCLHRYMDHLLEVKGMEPITFYGCAICQDSTSFIRAETIVAVLDETMAMETVQVETTLRVNWLARRQLFDFDRVEIVKAGDEAIERFAVQVGNDTDPRRKRRYPGMEWIILPGNEVAESTMKILERTFGRVKQV